jgi:iron(III) transport system substrate-binding protein
VVVVKELGWILIGVVLLGGCLNESNEVVVYVAHDQDYSEPILRDFEAETGIKVRALYDTEATKTVGLVNKLIAEKDNPQADVFWNNEVSRTIVLKNQGVLTKYKSPNAVDKPSLHKDPDGYWTGFGARARVIIYNTNLVGEQEAPTSILDFTKPRWKGKFCMANPLFGTTGSHVASIFALRGSYEAKNFFHKLKDNNIKIVESNGRVRDLVVAGEFHAGITDTDDANDAVQEGKPVKKVFPDQGEGEIGTLVIPNSVMLIKGGPNPENGKKLVDYLLGKKVEQKLSESKAMQMPLGKNVPHPKHVPDVNSLRNMQVSHYEIFDKLEESQKFIQELLIT